MSLEFRVQGNAYARGPFREVRKSCKDMQVFRASGLGIWSSNYLQNESVQPTGRV